MPTFTAADGTQLAYHVRGEGEPLLCLPGGPMRASAYLGDLGGLSRQRRLVMLDLRGSGDSGVPGDPGTYRCDRQVDDVEALRRHFGWERVDVLAHSASGDLAILYAARHPHRIRTLSLITARARALGVDFTGDHRREVVALRAAEPWWEAARAGYEAIWFGSPTDADFDAAAPFFYGRWDAATQAHFAAEPGQINEQAAEIYASAGAFDPAAAREAVAALAVPVLVLAGELDSGPRPHVGAGIAALFPHAELVTQAGAGHFPWLDDPARFTGVVADFLTRSRLRQFTQPALGGADAGWSHP
ncbi:alpha/beta hydrolase [Streptomyces sp. TRM66268-LWL]|uniref:Alpha/beta hydrolase n=1 Tax=Streptomyces polyasparticus TaxID=2767826 RepID=A0ABR7SEA6_9ACTN|nr:alpha/beta hydrolase [Streptomyces polyasparticus]MBC9712663.1 alpha/beta hydrolase [Streptomyces polyasparticus]